MSICGIDRVFADPSGLGFCKRPSSLNMPGLYAAHLLPTANGDIDVKRIKFYEAGDPSSPFSSQTPTTFELRLVKDRRESTRLIYSTEGADRGDAEN